MKYSKAVKIIVAMETAIRDASDSNPVPRVDKLTEHKQTDTKETGDHPPLLPLRWEHTYNTIAFTRTRFATTMENRAIFSGFVVPNSNASLRKQPKTPRYMLLKLMLMLMKTS